GPRMERRQAHPGLLIPVVQHQGAKERFSPIDAKDFLDGTRRLDDDADFGAPKRAPGRHFIVGHAVQRDLLTRSHPLRDIHAHPPLTPLLAYTFPSLTLTLLVVPSSVQVECPHCY